MTSPGSSMIPAARPDPDRPPPARRALRVLLVEHDPDLRQLLTWALHKDGFAVVGISTGTEGVNHLLRSQYSLSDPPDLVISDMDMPGCSGIEIVGTIGCVAPTTPVILITGCGHEEARARARRLGVTAVLDKPFDLDDFRWTVDNLIR